MASLINGNGNKLTLKQEGQSLGNVTNYIKDEVNITIENPATTISSSTASASENPYLNGDPVHTLDSSTGIHKITWNWKDNVNKKGDVLGVLNITADDNNISSAGSSNYMLKEIYGIYFTDASDNREYRYATPKITVEYNGLTTNDNTGSTNPKGIYQESKNYSNPAVKLFFDIPESCDWLTCPRSGEELYYAKSNNVNEQAIANEDNLSKFYFNINSNTPSSSLGNVKGTLYTTTYNSVNTTPSTFTGTKTIYLDAAADSIYFKSGNGTSLGEFDITNADNSSATTEERSVTITPRIELENTDDTIDTPSPFTLTQNGNSTIVPNPTASINWSIIPINDGNWILGNTGNNNVKEFSFIKNTGSDGRVVGRMDSISNTTATKEAQTIKPFSISGWEYIPKSSTSKRSIKIQPKVVTTNDSLNGSGITNNPQSITIEQSGSTQYDTGVRLYWSMNSNGTNSNYSISKYSTWDSTNGDSGVSVTLPSNTSSTVGSVSGTLYPNPTTVTFNSGVNNQNITASGLTFSDTQQKATAPIEYTITCTKYEPSNSNANSDFIDSLYPQTPWSVTLTQEGQEAGDVVTATGNVKLTTNTSWLKINGFANITVTSNTLGGSSNNILLGTLSCTNNYGTASNFKIESSGNKIYSTIDVIETSDRSGTLTIGAGTNISLSMIGTAVVDVTQSGEQYKYNASTKWSCSDSNVKLSSTSSITNKSGNSTYYITYSFNEELVHTNTGSVSAFSPTSLTFISAGSNTINITDNLGSQTTTKEYEVTGVCQGSSTSGLTNFNVANSSETVTIKQFSRFGEIPDYTLGIVNDTNGVFSISTNKSTNVATITCDPSKISGYSTGNTTNPSGSINNQTKTISWTTSTSNNIPIINDSNITLGISSGTTWPEYSKGTVQVTDATSGNTGDEGPICSLKVSAKYGTTSVIPLSISKWEYVTSNSGISISSSSTNGTISSDNGSFSRIYNIYVTDSAKCPQYPAISISDISGTINGTSTTSYKHDSINSTTITCAIKFTSSTTGAAPVYTCTATGTYYIGSTAKTVTNTINLTGSSISLSNLTFSWSSSDVTLSSTSGSSINVTLPTLNKGTYGASRGTHTVICNISFNSSSIGTVTFTIDRGTYGFSDTDWIAHNS